MKESKLIEMRNKVESLGAALNKVIQELTNLRDLSIGTMQLVKKFPGYEKAIEELKKELTKKEKSKDGTV